jgi:proteasome lid subunit RPN8/RPN11
VIGEQSFFYHVSQVKHVEMLKITRQLQDQINDHAISSYPFEGCGILLGHAENGENIVTSIFPVPNRWENEEEKRVRFRISGQDMLRAELAAAEQDIDVIGIFHSHPDHPPIASPRDLAWAAWPGFSYLITEIRERQPGISRSWQLLEDRSGFVEEEVNIAD